MAATVAYTEATYIGRWGDLTTPYTCRCVLSSGSRLRATFTGTSLTLVLWVPSRTHPIEVEYSVDGAAFTRTTVTGNLTVASGLADTTHTVEVWLSGNEEADYRWPNHYGLAVRSFTVDTGRTLTAWPTGNRYRMLTIGDSIAEGDLALGVGSPESEQPAVDSGRTAPGNLIGATIGADNYNFAFSGASASNAFTAGGYPKMPSMLPYSMSGVAHTDPAYDLVWIELGANDASTASATFRTDYAAIIDWVRSVSPNAHIVCSRPINSWATARRADIEYVAGVKGCTYVDISASIDAPYLGHPSVTGQQQMAAFLRSYFAAVVLESGDFAFDGATFTASAEVGGTVDAALTLTAPRTGNARVSGRFELSLDGSTWASTAALTADTPTSVQLRATPQAGDGDLIAQLEIPA